jgi:hypothetical protein
MLAIVYLKIKQNENKRAGSVAQVVQSLPNKYEALGPILSTDNNNNNKYLSSSSKASKLILTPDFRGGGDLTAWKQ